ncbi:conserved hypothetical protein [Bradyrhizobium sp. ORS 278]|nr:conserved hypothetical protein [Bradyrhizobium sp. ORS 278]
MREAGAVVECEAHGWMLERGDPHALARALALARHDPPGGVCSPDAVAAIEEALSGIGDTCPDCSRSGDPEEVPRFK